MKRCITDFSIELIIVFVLIVPFKGLSQYTFHKHYLASGFNDESNTAPYVLNTIDSGFYLFATNTDSSLTNDCSLSITRLNKQGSIMWNKQSDRFPLPYGYGYGDVAQFPDTSFVMEWNENTEFHPVFSGLIHTDKNGNTIWAKKYSIPADTVALYGNELYINSIARTLDNGIIAWGQLTEQIPSYELCLFLMKTDSSGNIEWCKQYIADTSIEGTPQISRIALTNDSGFIVDFDENIHDTNWGGLMKVDKSGNPEWVKLYSDISLTFCKPIVLNNTIVISGDYSIISFNKITPLMVLKTDMQGIPIWTKFYYNYTWQIPYDDYGLCDGSILFTILDSLHNASIMKIDSSSNIIWENDYRGVDTLPLTNVASTLDGGILGYGFDYRQSPRSPVGWDMIKVDNLGRNGCQGSSATTVSNMNISWVPSTIKTEHISLSVTDTTLTFLSALMDTTIICSVLPALIDTPTICIMQTAGINTIPAIQAAILVYPNPNSGVFTISINNLNKPAQVIIYNMLGEAVYQSKLALSNTQINISNRPPGIYLYRVIDNEGISLCNGKLAVL